MTATLTGEASYLILAEAGVGIGIAVPLEGRTLQVPDAPVTWLQHIPRQPLHLWMATHLRMMRSAQVGLD